MHEQSSNSSGNVNTGGGDFVNRDQNIQGDLIHGNKNVIVQQVLSASDIRDQNNLRTLRQLVYKYWIKGLLGDSLSHEAAIQLRITDHSALIENRLRKLIPQQPSSQAQLLPSDTHILDVFDQMNQCLLILGEPGAGKTTLLLELTRALLIRADKVPSYPSPVVFNLSSWAQRQVSIAEWLVDELTTLYAIPKKIAQSWVAQGKLLLLLDGLDEIQSAHRAACTQAINQFHDEHLVPLVVCSRITEYENLAMRLRLHGAILLQPLTTEQINTYLSKAGPTLAAVRIILQHDIELQTLAQSPLMLRIMTLAYQGIASSEIELTDTTQTRRQHLFATYIQRMFVQREIASIYSARQTLRWLQWLATRLQKSGQTIFLIERIQPSWFSKVWQCWTYGIVTRLLIGLIIGLTNSFIIGQIQKINYDLASASKVSLFVGIIFGFSVGIGAGLLDGYELEKHISLLPSMPERQNPSYIAYIVYTGVYTVLISWLLLEVASIANPTFTQMIMSIVGQRFVFNMFGDLTLKPIHLLVFALGNGVIGTFVASLFYWSSSIKHHPGNEIQPVESITLLWQPSIRTFSISITSAVIYLMISGVLGGVYNALVFALVSAFVFGLCGGLTNKEISTKTIPNQGIRLSLQNAAIAGTIISIIMGSTGYIIWGTFAAALLGSQGALWFGASSVIQHGILRFLLTMTGVMPLNYVSFLDYCTERIFLRKVGGGYIFIHRLLMEHFAAMTEEDIKRLTSTPS